MAEITTPIDVVRGDTLFSEMWHFTNEEVPKGITWQEFITGIESGIYTLIDLSLFNITGNVRYQFNSEIVWDLTPNLVITNNTLKFILPPETTQVLANERHTLGYDIEFTEKSTGHVKTMIDGAISITQDWTHSDPVPTKTL